MATAAVRVVMTAGGQGFCFCLGFSFSWLRSCVIFEFDNNILTPPHYGGGGLLCC